MQTDAQFLAEIETTTEAFLTRLREWRDRRIDAFNPGAVTLLNRINDAIDNLEPLLMIMPGVKSYAIATAKHDDAKVVLERPAHVMVTEEEPEEPSDEDRVHAVIAKIDAMIILMNEVMAIAAFAPPAAVNGATEASNVLQGLRTIFVNLKNVNTKVKAA